MNPHTKQTLTPKFGSEGQTHTSYFSVKGTSVCYGVGVKKFVFIISLILLLGIAVSVSADTVGEKQVFYVDPSYDLSERQELTAILVKKTSKLYFYVDEKWWNFTPQNEIYQALSSLGQEFDNKIYPILTSTFGPEWNPGIDKDSQITILIHPMKESAGGYFRSNDEYSKLQIFDSNEREMIYLNAEHIRSPLAKSFLAHEFTHLITFHQKENTYGVIEEIWLNEARAEYAPTLIGYDDYKESNLERRIQIFSDNPSDSIIDWQNTKYDYGAISLFIQYLVDHYGIEILIDSLHSPETGIKSINYALEKNGFEENFSQIFLDWVIAVLVNDCNYGSKYCYKSPNLKNFHVTSKINFLPLTGESMLTIGDVTKNWKGNWYKIIGGSGNLKLEFISNSAEFFEVPYIIKNRSGNYIIDFLKIHGSQGEIYIKDFGTEITSLFIIPVVNKLDSDSFYSFSWSVSIERPEEEDNLINNLLARIEFLKAEIAKIRVKIIAILNKEDKKPLPEPASCSFNTNLYYGLNSEDVKCLQNFLKSQGPDIYPEGLVTGNFLSLTKSAVIRFQEKYAQDILIPLDLTNGTGFVGLKTRAKINQLLTK